MNTNYNKITKDIVFKLLCDIESHPTYSGLPTTIPYLMDSLLSSKHQITKYIHELRDCGLVELVSLYFDPKTHQRVETIDNTSLLLRGWVLTEEAKKTVIYMEATQKSLIL